MKDALKAAEGENVDLKRQIDTLKARPDKSIPNSPQKKRKKPDEDVILVPRSPKRLKQNASAARVSISVDGLTADFDFAEVGEVGKFLLYHPPSSCG